MDEVNVIQLSLMMADSPHYIEPGKKNSAFYMKKLKEGEKDSIKSGVDPLTFFTQFATND